MVRLVWCIYRPVCQLVPAHLQQCSWIWHCCDGRKVDISGVAICCQSSDCATT